MGKNITNPRDMFNTKFEDSFSEEVWRSTYKDHNDKTINDTLFRVAKAAADMETTPELREEWTLKFYDLLSNFKATSGGRIYSNAGTEWNGTTLMNCVSGDTKIVTSDGIVLASEIAGKTVNVLTANGDFQKVDWNSFGVQELYKATFSNGEIIHTTRHHEWVVTKQKGGEERIKTTNLQNRRIPLNGIAHYEYKKLDEYEAGIRNGLIFGDGYVYTDFSDNNRYSALQQFGDSRHLVLDHFDWLKVTNYKGDKEGIHYINGQPEELKYLPNLNKTTDYLRGFIAGVIAADGCVDSRGSVMLHTANYEYATKIKEIAVRVGLPVISLRLERENSPFDGKKSELWKLTFVKKYFKNDSKLILKKTHMNKMRESPDANTRTTIECVNVEKTNIPEIVYCCNEPTTHAFTLGEFGLLTGNCFVSPRRKYDIDSLDGILETVSNQSFTLKSEGGWGENFSYIRPRGSFIHGIGVESPGAVKYMEIFDKTSEIITAGAGKKSQNKKAKGKIRKGAMMGVLDCWHPDIIEFISAKQQSGRLTKFNMSVNCTDAFMEKVLAVIDMKTNKVSEEEIETIDTWELKFPDTTFAKYKEEWDGDLYTWEQKGYPVKVAQTVSATFLWNLIMESTYNRAEPGVLFLDRANYFGPLSYAERISATNPCCARGTLVNTPTGYRKVEDIKIGDYISTTLGVEPTQHIEKHDSIKVFKIIFSDGGEEIVTAAHQYRAFRSSKRAEKRSQSIRVDALNIGDSVWVEPTKFNDETFNQKEYEKGLKIGILLGDGCYTPKTLNRDQLKIASNIDDIEYNNAVKKLFGEEIFNKDDLASDNSKSMYMAISKKYHNDLIESLHLTPAYSYEKVIPMKIMNNLSIVRGVLDGLLATDGNVNLTSNNPQIRFFTTSNQLAQDIRRLLLYVNSHGRIHLVNSKGGIINGREIISKHDKLQISISGASVKSFFKYTKLNTIHNVKYDNLVKIVSQTRLTGNNWVGKIVSITEHGHDEVYDLYCEKSDTWITSGYVQRGCGEQMLAPGGVCNLASLNLTQFINSSRTGFDIANIKKYVGYIVRFLDNISDLSDAPLPEYVASMREKRRIGIGILGWGSALFMLKVRFGSEAATGLRDELMRAIARESYMYSIDLAVEKGMFEKCIPEKHADGVFVKSLELPEQYMNKLASTGIRNSSLLSIQPTGNTSIQANVVSGGLEPIFMPEYIRTIIVNTMPDEIADVTPVWYEGEWHETSMFKFTKEGDEEILKGTGPDGTVYKIDKSRGLLKEVLCEDYGVRYLKRKGEWDENADWAVTTTNLAVEDHVNDLKGFARWVDSAMSKTVNVPQNYPFEKFKNIYLDSYRSGYVKGVTTYRSGIMTSVLSAKEEKNATVEDEEIIKEDVKLPDSANATMKTIRAENRKWYLTVVYHEDNQERPFALFVKTNAIEKGIVSDEAIELLFKLARKKKIPKRHINEVYDKLGSDTNSSKVARLISFLLRHGVLIRNIVAVLDKVENAYVGTFVFQIKKFLSVYIKDGELVEDEICQECGSTSVVFSEGCRKCVSCGSSKCG